MVIYSFLAGCISGYLSPAAGSPVPTNSEIGLPFTFDPVVRFTSPDDASVRLGSRSATEWPAT